MWILYIPWNAMSGLTDRLVTIPRTWSERASACDFLDTAWRFTVHGLHRSCLGALAEEMEIWRPYPEGGSSYAEKNAM